MSARELLAPVATDEDFRLNSSGTKALGLLSGGLDSSLAIGLMQKLGIEMIALNFENVFHPGVRGGESFADRSARALGVELLKRDSTEMLLAAVRNPRFGFGRHLNPCMDCRTHMLTVAKGMLAKLGAGFIVSGEVLGQRPMSQRRQAMDRIDRAADVEGLVLRPLSAKAMPQTLPEREGWVRREDLLGIRGRSRRTQYQLAETLGVRHFASPAGGCLLTDPGFTSRMQDLMDGDPDFTENDVELLKTGRHFRLAPGCKAAVGRDQADNERIESLAGPGDVLVEVAAGHSPVTLVPGKASEDDLARAAALTARYSKSRGESKVECSLWQPARGEDRGKGRRLETAPASEETIDRLAIGRTGEL